jgi:hypothetical protein
MALMEASYQTWLSSIFTFLPAPFGVSSLVFVIVAVVLILVPLRNAGRPEDPAPPSAMV